MISLLTETVSKLGSTFFGSTWIGTIFVCLLPWFVTELAFVFVFYKVWLPRFQKLRPPDEYRDYSRDRLQLFYRILERFETTSKANNIPVLPVIQSYIREWFQPSSPEVSSKLSADYNYEFWPRRLDMDEFIAWAFFGKHRDDLEDWMVRDMATMYDVLEQKYGLTFEPGMTPNMKPMRLTLDPLEPSYRPFFVYCFFGIIKTLSGLFLRASGFYVRRTSTGLRYWYRPEKQKSNKLPILFLHGIAPGGLAVYLPMLFYLGKDGRPLLFFENPGICFGIHFGNPPNERETTVGVLEAVNKHLGSRGVSVVGHSFGSCPVTWLIHSPLKTRIRQVVLADPVSILLSEPDVLQNFLYQRRALQKQKTPIKIGVISNEIFTENYLRRHFAWYNSELWIDDLPSTAKVLVCLSGKDPIVPTEKVRKEVTLRGKKEHVDLLIWEDAGHAHCVMRPKTWKQMQMVMRRQEQMIIHEGVSSKLV